MVDLSLYNTLRVPARADNLIELHTVADFGHIDTSRPYLILGQGANILFVKDFPGTIYLNKYSGVSITSETETSVVVEANSGHSWHDLVMFSVDKQLWGLENMALIPGSVGAAVVGNIAAYGQNQQSVFTSAQLINLQTQQIETWTAERFSFGYRHSVLKEPTHHHHGILSARYTLSRLPRPELSYNATRHPSLKPILDTIAQPPYTSRNLADAVTQLRTAKLPDWHSLPNAGSFFKNPLVTKKKYVELQSQVPDLQAYPPTELRYETNVAWLEQAEFVKLPAGRLIDELGWRGKRIGNVGTHANHALVIVNYGATGQEIYTFTENIRADVKKAYDIDLEYEVQLIS